MKKASGLAIRQEGSLLEVTLPPQVVGAAKVTATLTIDPAKIGPLVARALERKGKTSLLDGAFVLAVHKPPGT